MLLLELLIHVNVIMPLLTVATTIYTLRAAAAAAVAVDTLRAAAAAAAVAVAVALLSQNCRSCQTLREITTIGLGSCGHRVHLSKT